MNQIPYVNLSAQWEEEREHLLPIIERVMASGQYIGGDEVEQFESLVAANFGVEYAVALNSGTDALVFGLAALGVQRGDEVITPPNSFVASTAAIVHLGARPVFVDVQEDQNINPSLIEAAISSKTKVIMPIHLSGKMSEMKKILEIANRYGLGIVEDAAQAAGSKLGEKFAGSWGSVGCFSAHPLKNLNACGDAGFITTNEAGIARKIRSMRNHGLIDRDTVGQFGYVSRMDAIQAAILTYRLSVLPKVISRRRKNVKIYNDTFSPNLKLDAGQLISEQNSWHTFVIQVKQRDELRQFLTAKGIETAIHYPIPLHLQPAATNLGYRENDFPVAEKQAHQILTLPIHQYLTAEQIQLIANEINQFFVS